MHGSKEKTIIFILQHTLIINIVWEIMPHYIYVLYNCDVTLTLKRRFIQLVVALFYMHHYNIDQIRSNFEWLFNACLLHIFYVLIIFFTVFKTSIVYWLLFFFLLVFDQSSNSVHVHTRRYTPAAAISPDSSNFFSENSYLYLLKYFTLQVSVKKSIVCWFLRMLISRHVVSIRK